MKLIYLIFLFVVVCNGAPLEETLGEEKNERQLLGDVLSQMNHHDANPNTGFGSEFENDQSLQNFPPFINTDQNESDFEEEIDDVDQGGNITEGDLNSEDEETKPVATEGLPNFDFNNLNNTNPFDDAVESLNPLEEQQDSNALTPAINKDGLEGGQAEEIPEHWDIFASNDNDHSMEDINEKSNELLDDDLSEDNGGENVTPGVPNTDHETLDNAAVNPTNPLIVEAGESYKEKVETDPVPYMDSTEEDNTQEAEGVLESNSVQVEDAKQNEDGEDENEMNGVATGDEELGENLAADNNSLITESDNNIFDENEIPHDIQYSNVIENNDMNGDVNEPNEAGSVETSITESDAEEISYGDQDIHQDIDPQGEAEKVEANGEENVNPAVEEPTISVETQDNIGEEAEDIAAVEPNATVVGDDGQFSNNGDINEKMQDDEVGNNLAMTDVDTDIKEEEKTDNSLEDNEVGENDQNPVQELVNDNVSQQESKPLSVDGEQYDVEGDAFVGDNRVQIEESDNEEVIAEVDDSELPQTIPAESVEQSKSNYFANNQQVPGNTDYRNQQWQSGGNPDIGNVGEVDGNFDEPHSPVLSHGDKSDYGYDIGDDDLPENDFDKENAQKVTIVNTENGHEGDDNLAWANGENDQNPGQEPVNDNVPPQESNLLSADSKEDSTQIEEEEPFQILGDNSMQIDNEEVIEEVDDSDLPQTILAESVEQSYVEQDLHDDEDQSEYYVDNQQVPANTNYGNQQSQIGGNPDIGNLGEVGGNFDEPHSPVLSDGDKSEYGYDLGNDDLTENYFDTENGREGDDYESESNDNEEEEKWEDEEEKWEDEEEEKWEDDNYEFGVMNTTMANEINEYGTQADERSYDDDDDFLQDRENVQYDSRMIEEIEEETKQSSFFSFVLLSTVIVLTIFLCVRSPALFYSFFLCCKTGKVAKLFPGNPKRQGYSILPMGDKSV